MTELIFLFIIFIISFLSLRNSLDFLKVNFSDEPNLRSTHKISKPKSGGYIFVLSALVSPFFELNLSLFIIIPLAIIGLIDDKFNLSPKVRLLSQFIICFILSILLSPSYFLINNFGYISLPIIILIGVSIINFSNFMDGIDGLVAGCYLVIFVTAALFIGKIYIPIIGVLLAFLIFNWSPSKLFMGDVGSTFLGGLFLTVLLQCKSFEEFVAFILISIPLMLDAFICVIRRFLKRKNIFKPHRDHLYQRLYDNKFPDYKISTLYILSTAIISFSYTIYGLSFSIISTLVVICLGIYLDRNYALEFN